MKEKCQKASPRSQYHVGSCLMYNCCERYNGYNTEYYELPRYFFHLHFRLLQMLFQIHLKLQQYTFHKTGVLTFTPSHRFRRHCILFLITCSPPPLKQQACPFSTLPRRKTSPTASVDLTRHLLLAGTALQDPTAMCPYTP